MTATPENVIAAFRALHVLVIGDAMLDSYLAGTADKLCREAPVPIVSLQQRDDAPGGAANTAVNARRLGARVTLLSVIGDDDEGRRLAALLEQHGVNTAELVRDASRRTLFKQRVLAGSQLLLRVDQGSTGAVDACRERHVLDRLEALIPQVDAVIVSDYGYGILTPQVIDGLAKWQSCAPRVIAVDSKCLTAYRQIGVTVVKPNYAEALRLLGEPEGDACASRAEHMARLGPQLLQCTGARLAAITLDTDGALLLERNAPPYRTYAQPTEHSNAAGAGDTFLSALALALAANADTAAAAEIASAAAAVVVGEHGTSTCSAEDLQDALSAGSKIVTRTALIARVKQARRQGRTIVFTNGCFDILHAGHTSYLSQASRLGDLLIVGVNTDASVRRLKGAGRPINALEERAQVLAALNCVDLVAPFEEATPTELIRLLRPDVFVKGGDYTRESLPEAALVEAYGGAVHILPYLPHRSTSLLIDRIRAGSGAVEPRLAPVRPSRA